MKKEGYKDIFKILVLFIVVAVIIPWSVLFFFLGKDAWKFIGYITLVAILCFVFLPGYVLYSLARSEAPLHIGKFFYEAYNSIKNGIVQHFRRETK